MIVKNKSISMTRGDSESITVRCPEVPFETGDVITMTVREDAQSDIVLQIAVTEFNADGSALLPIAPEDTASLDFGKYVYDIQLARADGTVTTLITPGRFTLTEEVTY